MKINHDIQLSDGKLKHFLNINNLPKSIIEDIFYKKAEIDILEKERKERSAPDAIGEIKAPKDGGTTSKVDDGNKTSPISGKAKGK